MLHWYLLEHRYTQIPDNSPFESRVNGNKKIGILKKGEELSAFGALCPHAGAPMCDGWLDATGKLVCPLHKYRFDPKNGRNTSGEGYKLFIYPIKREEDNIYIGFMQPL